MEEDFFVRTADELLPVEVKANDHRSKSLSTLVNSDHYHDIRYGIKLADSNIGYANGIFTFPYYCAFLIKKFLKTYKMQDQED